MSDYWYPFYPSRFKAATRHLTAEQDGIYRRLIDEYMETREPLPDNDIALARIAGVNENKWLDAKRILYAYFTHSEGMIFHEFCDQQLDIQDKKAKKRTESAKKAAKKRWSKNQQNQEDKCDSHAQRNADAMRGNATNTNTDIKEKNNKKKKVEKPKDVSHQIWKDFKLLRQRKKAPITETALEGILNEAKKINWTLEQAMAEMCAKGWQGFEAKWITEEKNIDIGFFEKKHMKWNEHGGTWDEYKKYVQQQQTENQ